MWFFKILYYRLGTGQTKMNLKNSPNFPTFLTWSSLSSRIGQRKGGTMRNRNLVLSISLLLFFMINFSCARQKPDWEGTIEEADGVTIVKNPQEPMYSADVFKLEEELSIGEAEGAEEYMFVGIRSVVVDKQERIYVSDFDGNVAHIKVFDKAGNYVMTIGRKGEGPGEFLYPTFIKITPENELMVYDRFTRKLIFFSLEGDYLRTSIFKEVNQALNISLTSKGHYLVCLADFQKKVNDDTYYIAHELSEYGSDFSYIRTIVKGRARKNSGFQSWMMIHFLSSDAIICGFSENFEFHIYNPEGEIIRKFSKPFDAIKISEGEKERRRLNREKGLPGYFPAFQDFSVDDEGRVFVQLYERQMDEDVFYFDVFDAEGKYITKVPLKFFPRFWRSGKMYTEEVDEEGYNYIKRYKVTWNF